MDELLIKLRPDEASLQLCDTACMTLIIQVTNSNGFGVHTVLYTCSFLYNGPNLPHRAEEQKQITVLVQKVL